VLSAPAVFIEDSKVDKMSVTTDYNAIQLRASFRNIHLGEGNPKSLLALDNLIQLQRL
jgi:hypothetical protein